MTGRFVPHNPRAAKESVGFLWNALCTMSRGALAELYLRAKAVARRGDINALKQFYQKRLALPWRKYAEDYKLEITRSGYHKGELWEDEAGVNARDQPATETHQARQKLPHDHRYICPTLPHL